VLTTISLHTISITCATHRLLHISWQNSCTRQFATAAYESRNSPRCLTSHTNTVARSSRGRVFRQATPKGYLS
jgi:hypothetical protein